MKTAIAAACLTVATGLAPPAAHADNKAGSIPARDLLHNVPVFYVADEDGAPVKINGSDEVTYYLTRAQASIAVGMARADLAEAGKNGDALHVELTDLREAAVDKRPHEFFKPSSRLPAAASIPGVPLFLVRDGEGTPFTLRDANGKQRVYFYLSEKDAQAFALRILKETGRKTDDVTLSIVSLDPVLDSILNSRDPLVQNWTIWSSAETRKDADSLKTAEQALLAPALRPE
ncbi:MAG: hypothetical protein GC155_10705 [Alphaproteobacteria bacterium]|nr:hypothetical protein [Alphaproteobacteria bacterium]